MTRQQLPAFEPPVWAADTNIYEVNLRQYTPEGTLQAFSNHLSRLRNMGVEVLWFMPITPIATENRLGTLGSYYASADYTSVNPEYGTLEDFTALVEQAHVLGMKVIIDWVANHTGYGHTWTQTHPEFYLKDTAGHFTERNGWKDVIDLDYNHAGLRDAMITAMAFWVKTCGIDGFRCDMAHLVPLDFWVEARTRLDQEKPLFWLAECDVPAYHAAFDCSYAWDFMHRSAAFSQSRQSTIVLEKVLMQYQMDYPLPGTKLFFTSNHDENSWNGTEYEKYGAEAMPLAVFTALYQGIPLVYTGQELPLNRRLKFFDKDPINWEGGFQLEAFYKALLELRKRHPALKNDAETAPVWLPMPGERQIGFFRRSGHRMVVVLLHFNAEPWQVRIEHPSLEGKFQVLYRHGQQVELQGMLEHTMEPYGYLILEK